MLLAGLFVTAAAAVFSARQPPLYQSSAKVLVKNQDLAASLTGLSSQGGYQPPDRFIATQAGLARVPSLAVDVLRAAGIQDSNPDAFLSRSSVEADPAADLLVFSVTDSTPEGATRLATIYATRFTSYKLNLEVEALEQVRRDVEARLAELEATGKKGSLLYRDLTSKARDLNTLEALQTSSAIVVSSGDIADRVQPQPIRSGMLGLVLGLVLGVSLAFVMEALDTRLRTADEVGRALPLPLLGRLPVLPRRLSGRRRLVMLNDPESQEAEAYRLLRSNLELWSLNHQARLLLVTSASEQEGKSTIAANLAVALARTRWRVILVDLDLRRPMVHDLFQVDQKPGLVGVAVGAVDLHRALVPVELSGPLYEAVTFSDDGRRNGPSLGELRLLPAGILPPAVSEFMGSPGMAEVLQQLREEADIVILDGPPALGMSDVVSLSGSVDGLVVVTRLGSVRRPVLDELRRVLATVRCPLIGYVVNAVSPREPYVAESDAFYRPAERQQSG
jgi:Mrp family chromosome partitioning ATPase/capsular polysaccharide biosynthesis protein